MRVVGSALVLLFLPGGVYAQGGSPHWSGFYVGAHAGTQPLRVEYNEPANPQYAIDPRIGGFVGGLLGGYNHQVDRLVLGVEADAGRGTVELNPGDSGGNRYTALDVDWNAHLRGRVGYAWRGVILFAAGGLAIGRVTIDDVDAGFGVDRATHVGWTTGGGLEYAVTRRLGLRGDYLFDDYGTQRYTIASPPGPFFPAYTSDTALTGHTVRAAVVYRF